MEGLYSRLPGKLTDCVEGYPGLISTYIGVAFSDPTLFTLYTCKLYRPSPIVAVPPALNHIDGTTPMCEQASRLLECSGFAEVGQWRL